MKESENDVTVDKAGQTSVGTALQIHEDNSEETCDNVIESKLAKVAPEAANHTTFKLGVILALQKVLASVADIKIKK